MNHMDEINHMLSHCDGCNGWKLSDFDTWHACPFHYKGQLHPEDAEDIFQDAIEDGMNPKEAGEELDKQNKESMKEFAELLEQAKADSNKEDNVDDVELEFSEMF